VFTSATKRRPWRRSKVSPFQSLHCCHRRNAPPSGAPGFGYSATPDPARFECDFAGYATFLDRFTTTLRLAIAAPERVAALIIQNGDIYEDQLGPKYEYLKKYWENPTAEGRGKLEETVSEEGFRHEFIGEVAEQLSDRIPPDLWKLAWAVLQRPERRQIMVGLMEGLKENTKEWFPRYQAYLREHQPPTLIVWGPQDGYMPEGAARAYLRDLPKAELHFVDGGHWALETNLAEVVAHARDFLQRVHSKDAQLERDPSAKPRRFVSQRSG
jgi:hypothetical protein